MGDVLRILTYEMTPQSISYLLNNHSRAPRLRNDQPELQTKAFLLACASRPVGSPADQVRFRKPRANPVAKALDLS